MRVKTVVRLTRSFKMQAFCTVAKRLSRNARPYSVSNDLIIKRYKNTYTLLGEIEHLEAANEASCLAHVTHCKTHRAVGPMLSLVHCYFIPRESPLDEWRLEETLLWDRPEQQNYNVLQPGVNPGKSREWVSFEQYAERAMKVGYEPTPVQK